MLRFGSREFFEFFLLFFFLLQAISDDKFVKHESVAAAQMIFFCVLTRRVCYDLYIWRQTVYVYDLSSWVCAFILFVHLAYTICI